MIKTPEMGDTTCDFYYPSILSANMGARGCDGYAMKLKGAIERLWLALAGCRHGDRRCLQPTIEV
jgi:hypothetical protein